MANNLPFLYYITSTQVNCKKLAQFFASRGFWVVDFEVSDLSYVEGFSERFRTLLGHTNLGAGKRHGLYSRGAEFLDVHRKTFKAYCEDDFAPNYEDLISIVEMFVADGLPGDHDARYLAAWLLFSDVLDNPFESNGEKNKNRKNSDLTSHT